MGPVSFATSDGGRETLQVAIRELRRALDPTEVKVLNDIPDFDVTAAHEIYAKLLKPVEVGWKDAKTLLVVTDGALGQLPLSLLPVEPAIVGADTGLTFDRYRSVPWLTRSHAVTVLPSVASLNALGGPRVAQVTHRPFVGFGDPYFNIAQQARARDQSNRAIQVASRSISLRSVPRTRVVDSAEIERLPQLADTRDEITAIAAALGADPINDVFLGERASESQVKSMDLSPYRVISFATHGLVPGDLNGLYQPALALSSPKVTGDTGDGLLTMDEILRLKLNADFAVLSACNTASADGRGAEAVSGLGRAFFYAGARSLLVSNWPVHSAATTELMTLTFRSLAKETGLTRAEALWRARIAMIDKGVYIVDGKAAFSYAHPIFWAPFTLVGDGGGTKAAIN